MFIKSFFKIKSLSEDFSCTGDIQTLNYYMHIYSQFIRKEPLDFFISGRWEIDLACQNMKGELDRFLDQLEKLFQTFFTVIEKKLKILKQLNKTKLLSKQDLIKQFTKFIFEDGTYSSGIYGIIEGIFLERMQHKYFFESSFERNFDN